MLLLPTRVTVLEATDTARLLTQGLAQETDIGVVVDASSLQHFDSSALAVLLECRRLAEARGKTFAVRGAPPKLAALARLYGVDQLLSGTAPAASTAG